ncbi:hypothetical protein [Butyrivibrio sp. NC3005]|uniref:hypothetical protein n=1 Tax=Butyrivibrio sp. NC3005 TaxID=1280685 RepID=UPI00041B7FA5|nr:hypothetical protein [Butyrivibrio sp. NC3005]
MYISMTTIDGSDYQTNEICTFYGIRYDKRYNTAVISTDHQKHDYVVPMTETKYEQMVDEIAIVAKEHNLFYMKNGVIFRCRKGEIRTGEPQNVTVSY